MFRRKPAPDLIRGGYRFADKNMQHAVGTPNAGTYATEAAAWAASSHRLMFPADSEVRLLVARHLNLPAVHGDQAGPRMPGDKSAGAVCGGPHAPAACFDVRPDRPLRRNGRAGLRRQPARP